MILVLTAVVGAVATVGAPVVYQGPVTLPSSGVSGPGVAVWSNLSGPKFLGAQATFQSTASVTAPPASYGPPGTVVWTPGAGGSFAKPGPVLWGPGPQSTAVVWTAAAKAKAQWSPAGGTAWTLKTKAGAQWIPPAQPIVWTVKAEAKVTIDVTLWRVKTAGMTSWTVAPPSGPSVTWKCKALAACSWIFDVGIGQPCISGPGSPPAKPRPRNFAF